MNHSISSSLPRLTAAITSLLLVASLEAGVVRHDRDDHLYTELGAEYANVGQVQISQTDGNYLGSATLIDKHWVLTAAHVIDQATSLSISFDGGITSYDANDWVAHSEWNGDLGKGYDIGLMYFERDLIDATGLTAASLYRSSDEVGSISIAAGFGTTGTGLTGYTNLDGQRRAGENMVDALLKTPGKGNRILLTDFDNPNDPSDSSWGSSDPLNLEYLIAPGDSGGGLFIDDMLAGVHSFGWGRLDGTPDSDYGDAAGHTRVSSFTNWIDSVISPGGGGSGGEDDTGGGGRKGKGGGKPFDLAAVSQLTVEAPEPGTTLLLAAPLLVLAAQRVRRNS